MLIYKKSTKSPPPYLRDKLFCIPTYSVVVMYCTLQISKTAANFPPLPLPSAQITNHEIHRLARLQLHNNTNFSAFRSPIVLLSLFVGLCLASLRRGSKQIDASVLLLLARGCIQGGDGRVLATPCGGQDHFCY